MICKNCGTENAKSVRNCSNCGAALAAEQSTAERGADNRITVHKGEFCIVQPGEDALSPSERLKKMRDEAVARIAVEKEEKQKANKK